MINIYIYNVYTELENILELNISIINQIKEKLSYEIGGFGAKKEKICLLKDNRILTGLTPYVISILRKNKIDYKLFDKRKKPEMNAYFKVNPDYQPRDYQQEIINRASSREIIQAATGA